MAVSKEIEIKCLLGDKGKADAFREKLVAKYPDAKVLPATSQLNHYFIDGDMKMLQEKISQYLNDDQKKSFSEIVEVGKSFSVRTRETDGKVMIVIKATLDSDTSDNGVSRMEFEEVLPMTLDELDGILQSSGFKYQAKWSRERVEYVLPGMNITLDKNAGYGYLTEFESVIGDGESIEDTKSKLMSEIESFGLEELPQARIERMFAYYNEHWPEYYGTDNVFNIE